MAKFPSPIGVLYISIFQHSLRTGRTVFRFRPLLGFFIFQLISFLIIYLLKVSVPYWGSLYFNQELDLFQRKGLYVSVPYWGSLYFNERVTMY